MMPIVESPKKSVKPTAVPSFSSLVSVPSQNTLAVLHPRHQRNLTNLLLTVKLTMSSNLVISPVTTPLIQLPRYHHSDPVATLSPQ